MELRRHTDNDGDELTAQGVADAEAIGREGLHPPYAAFISSGAARATQMLTILRQAAGQDDVQISEVAGLRSTVEDRWRDRRPGCGQGRHRRTDQRGRPGPRRPRGTPPGRGAAGVVESLPDGGRALVVGHSPTNEAAVAGLTGQTVEPLGKGAGVLLVEDGGRFTVRPL